MERNLVAVVYLAAVLGFTLVLGGCSMSNSSETLSDSISSPFEWSSGSSDSSSGGDSAYRRDVSDYTVAFAHSGAVDLDAFRSGLRQLAEERGVSNWEDDPLTCASVGRGLQRARLSNADALAFGQRLLGGDTPGFDALRAGYSSVQ